LEPFAIAGWIPVELHGVSFADFERGFTCEGFERMISGASVAFGKTRSNVNCGRASFDKHRGRMTATYSMEFAGVRRRGVWVHCFGRDGGVAFCFSAMEKDFAAGQPAFDALVESFRFDDGYGWEDTFPFQSIDWAAVVLKAALITGVGVLVAVAVWIV